MVTFIFESELRKGQGQVKLSDFQKHNIFYINVPILSTSSFASGFICSLYWRVTNRSAKNCVSKSGEVS